MHLQRVEEAETKPSLAASPAQQKSRAGLLGRQEV
jgi:hypothetical protein